MPLPREVRPTNVPALSVLARTAPPNQAVPDLQAMSQILYFSAGITRRRAYVGGEIYFRAAACTGALYEIELYLACGPLPGLEAGLYHFSPNEFALHRLRAGDYRHLLVEATAAEPSVASAPLIAICTGTYWRNAWKYQARTYRHFGWDNGTLLANLLAISTALRLPAKVLCGFVDDDVNRLLDVDSQREVTFSLVAIGQAAEPLPAPAGEIPCLDAETVSLSKNEVDYPAMREMHAASSLFTADEVAAWRGNTPATKLEEPEANSSPCRRWNMQKYHTIQSSASYRAGAPPASLLASPSHSPSFPPY
jgi:SagB-type dehydrogenase family enzyme